MPLKSLGMKEEAPRLAARISRASGLALCRSALATTRAAVPGSPDERVAVTLPSVLMVTRQVCCH